METKPRTPVIWLHGLECTCCTESFIRSYHPVAKDLVLSMISLDYDDTIMAAAGHQAEAALEDTIEKYKGNYILAVEGNVPLNDDGVNCIPGGETFLRKIKHVAAGAKAVIGAACRPPSPIPRTPCRSRRSSRTSPSCSCPAARRFPK